MSRNKSTRCSRAKSKVFSVNESEQTKTYLLAVLAGPPLGAANRSDENDPRAPSATGNRAWTWKVRPPDLTKDRGKQKEEDDICRVLRGGALHAAYQHFGIVVSWALEPTRAKKTGGLLGIRIGEASHPGPTGSRTIRRRRNEKESTTNDGLLALLRLPSSSSSGRSSRSTPGAVPFWAPCRRRPARQRQAAPPR